MAVLTLPREVGAPRVLSYKCARGYLDLCAHMALVLVCVACTATGVSRPARGVVVRQSVAADLRERIRCASCECPPALPMCTLRVATRSSLRLAYVERCRLGSWLFVSEGGGCASGSDEPPMREPTDASVSVG